MDTIKYLLTGKYDTSDPSYQQGIKDHYQSIYDNSPMYAEARADDERRKQEELRRQREAAAVRFAPLSDSTNPAQKGDACAVPGDLLENNRVTIEWAQSLRQRKEDYFAVVFENATRGFEQARLFIAVDKIEEFKKNPQQDGKYLFVVTDQYRYGQEDGEGKNRFLVYHDPSRVVFMRRFMYSYSKEETARVGEPLRTFKD